MTIIWQSKATGGANQPANTGKENIMMHSDLHGRKLSDILREYSSDYVCFVDDGNGSGFDKAGEFIHYDPDTMADLVMTDIEDGPTQSADGCDLVVESEWQYEGDDYSPSAYRWRVRF